MQGVNYSVLNFIDTMSEFEDTNCEASYSNTKNDKLLIINKSTTSQSSWSPKCTSILNTFGTYLACSTKHSKSSKFRQYRPQTACPNDQVEKHSVLVRVVQVISNTPNSLLDNSLH